MTLVMRKYKEYTEGDKAALKELRAEVQEKLGHEVKLGDILKAVEPLEDTPEILRDC